jgi:hypothetical protein
MRGKRREGFEHHPELQIESVDIASEESACGGKAAGWQIKSQEKQADLRYRRTSYREFAAVSPASFPKG